jgi:hypothetical protein
MLYCVFYTVHSIYWQRTVNLYFLSNEIDRLGINIINFNFHIKKTHTEHRQAFASAYRDNTMGDSTELYMEMPTVFHHENRLAPPMKHTRKWANSELQCLPPPLLSTNLPCHWDIPYIYVTIVPKREVHLASPYVIYCTWEGHMCRELMLYLNMKRFALSMLCKQFVDITLCCMYHRELLRKIFAQSL